jgi:hypothetical protein
MISAAPPLSAPPRASASPVWLATAASLLLVLALFLTGRVALLRLAIPVGAVFVGMTLYFRRPIGYFHFTLWVWFLTPLVRRLVDWRAGFEDHNLLLLAPLLVSMIAGLTCVARKPTAAPVRPIAFFFCAAGMFYGFAVGLIRWRLHASDASSAGEIVYALLNWLAPMLFGLHVYLRWPLYEQHKQAMQKSFLWATFLLGLYGVYQFIAPPPWDRLWLEHMLSDIGAESFGLPEPFQTRVWSTLNSPSVFADMLVTGLLLLFFDRSRIKPLAAVAGYSSFLLSLVRTSWLGWLVGLAVVARRSGGRQVGRLLLWLFLLPALVAPLMLVPQISTAVTERLGTFLSIKKDDSAQIRAEEYRVLLTSLAAEPFGEGLNQGQTYRGYMMDSGIIRLFYYFGWVGAALFLIGIGLCARGMSLSSARSSDDLVAPVYRAVLVAMMFEMLSENTFIGPSGAIVWICIGLGLSVHQTERVSSLQAEPLESLAGENDVPSVLVGWRTETQTW